MKDNLKIVWFATLAGLVVSVTGCCGLFGNCPPTILTQPQSQTVKQGTTGVSFSVTATNSHPVSYQWTFNSTNIVGATNATYTIGHPVDFPDVGEYRVAVSGSPTTVSSPAYLSVYAPAITGGLVVGGTLGSPIGVFTQTPTVTFNGITFNRAYVPRDPAGNVYLFYGPNVPNQTGIFQNTSRAGHLVISTVSVNNASAPTGSMVQQNFFPLTTVGSNGIMYPGAPQSQCGPVPLDTGTSSTYRGTILYIAATPPTSGAVYFNWAYQ